MSGAIRSLVERHARGLEDIAAAMQKDGIGLHATRVHVPVLRRMAEQMRGGAARGKTPHEFVDPAMSAYASADTNSSLPRAVVATLRATGVDLGATDTISLADLDTNLTAAGIAPSDRVAVKAELARLGRLR
jgi:hypothetical protein